MLPVATGRKGTFPIACEIEKAVRHALAEGRLKGNETFPARATVTLGGIGFSHEVNGEIELG